MVDPLGEMSRVSWKVPFFLSIYTRVDPKIIVGCPAGFR
jgi:hypothetical protein